MKQTTRPMFMACSRFVSIPIAVLLVPALVASATGDNFLKRAPSGPTRDEVEAALLAKMAGNFRPGATKDHIISLENDIRPLYKAVPHEEDGTLSHTVVRYVLHRFFAKRGWYIRGLEPKGNKTAGSDSLKDLQEWVPSFLQEFLEQLTNGHGISLRELAILAATLEDLVHQETINHLETAYQALELDLNATIQEDHVADVLEVFLMVRSLRDRWNKETFGGTGLSHIREKFRRLLKDQSAIQEWMRGVQKQIYPDRTEFDFNAIGRIVESIGQKYGSYRMMTGCDSLRNALFDRESQKPGRVRMSDFYKDQLSGSGALGEQIAFSEHISYLRSLGAIDETDPQQPYVIVPNYVASSANCMVESSFYMVCCRNGCEELMSQLEDGIAAEMATPAQVIHLVSGLSSGTVVAPGQLSATLVRRLHSIADSNSGQVPLHGRLFAQWMHHVFPRECSFPQERASRPQTPDEWMRETGKENHMASMTDMIAHVHGRHGRAEKPTGLEARKHHHFGENELPWSEAEDLLTPNRASRMSVNSGAVMPSRRTLRIIAVFLVLLSMAWCVTQMSTSSLASAKLSKLAGSRSSSDFLINTCKLA